MCADTKSTGDTVKPVRRKFRFIKWFSVVIAALLLIVLFGVPALISSSAGTGFLVNKVNAAVDGKLDMKDLNVGWFRGVRLKELSFANSKGTTKVNVKEITAKPNYASMLSGNMSLGKVVIDKPEISIFLEAAEDEDASGGSDKEESQKTDAKNAAVIFHQADVTIKDGDIKILPAKGEVEGTIHFSNIASKVDLKGAGERSSFDIAMDVESDTKNSKISAKGDVTPSKKGWSFKTTEGQMKVKIDKLDLATVSPILALLGKDIDVGGEVNVDAEVKFGDGQVQKLIVDAKLDRFKHVSGEKVIMLTEPVTVTGRVSSKDGKVDIDRVDLKSSFCTITGKGSGTELDYKADMDIEKTMDFVGTFVDLGGYKFSGTGQEAGKITFKDDTIRVSDDGSMDNFVMARTVDRVTKKTPSIKAKFTFDMLVDLKKESLKVDYLTMKTDDTLADVRISDSMFAWGEDSRENVDLKVAASVNLAEVKPFAMFFDAVPEKMVLEGMAKSELAVKGRGSEYSVVTDKTTVSGLKVAAEGLDRKFEDENVKVMFDMTLDFEDKSVLLKKFLIDGTKIDVDGNFKHETNKRDQAEVSGKVTAKYDTADIGAIASAYLPEGLEMEGKRSEVFTFESKYPAAEKNKLLANLNASGKFGFDKAKYMGMKIGKVDVPVVVKDGVLDIKPFSTTVNKGVLNFAGNADLRKKPIVFTIPKPMQIVDKVQIDDEMGKALLKYLNPLFAEQTNLSGVANLRCEKLVMPLGGDTKIADAQIAGTVAMSDMKMQNQGLLGMIMSQGLGRTRMDADLLPTKIVLNKGFVSYDNMQVNIDNVYPINFGGAINLNKKPGRFKNMLAALPYKLSILDGGLKSIKIGEDTKDRVILPVEGNVDDPRIDLEKLLKDLGKKALGEILKETLKQKNGSEGEKSDGEKVIEGIFDYLERQKK